MLGLKREKGLIEQRCKHRNGLYYGAQMTHLENNSDHVPVEKPVVAKVPVGPAVVEIDSNSLSSTPTSAPGEDRRSWPRRKRAIQVVIQAAGGAGDPFPAWVMDRSIGGLGLSIDQPVEPGTILRVRRPTAPADIPWVEIQVKSVRIKETTWEIGCQFTRSLTFDVLMQFG
jgi:hypothetical protein